MLQRSKTQGASRCRLRSAQGGGRKDLLWGRSDHQTMAQEASRDRRRGAKASLPGRPSIKGRMLQQLLPQQLTANHDLTLEECREAFEEELGVAVSTSTVGRAIAHLGAGGWPIKKV